MKKKSLLQGLLESIGAEISAYSGRGMYGEKCLAVTDFDVGPLFAEVLRWVEPDDLNEIAESFDSLKTDSLGRGTVIYFPGTPFYEDSQESEEDSQE